MNMQSAMFDAQGDGIPTAIAIRLKHRNIRGSDGDIERGCTLTPRNICGRTRRPCSKQH